MSDSTNFAAGNSIAGLFQRLSAAAKPAQTADTKGSPDRQTGPPLDAAQLIREIVDDFQPLVQATHAAVYWYLLRNSVLAGGSPLIRTPGSRLRKSAAKPRCGRESGFSYIRKVLAELEAVGAIRREGEANRDGTLYRVLLPSEIEACVKFRAQRTAPPPQAPVAESEADYYNVRANRLKIYERDGFHCFYCKKLLTLATATLDHVIPVAKGGGNNPENLVTACHRCNSRKRTRPVGDALAELP